MKQSEGVKYDFTLNSKQLFETTEQKGFGLIKASELSRKFNVDNRCYKAREAVYFLKGNISSLAAKNTKHNACVGYVIPVIKYASPACFANKIESKQNLSKGKQLSGSWAFGIRAINKD